MPWQQHLIIGSVMVIGGGVLFLMFQDVETPVVGLRQLGLVLAVLGVVELAVTAYRSWIRGESR